MDYTINEKIEALENRIAELESKLSDVSKNVEEKTIQPYTKSGGYISKCQINPIDPTTGFLFGGRISWNNSELQTPPFGVQPSAPTKGYNKHFHSRYSGGALDINSFELAEYETNINGEIIDKYGNVLNRHCQQFWKYQPNIKKLNGVEKIGKIDIEFDSDSGKWIAGAKDIDVERTYLVQYDISESGEKTIKLDTNGNEMKSPLYNSDSTKTNIIWDESALVWRFLAVYAPE